MWLCKSINISASTSIRKWKHPRHKHTHEHKHKKRSTVRFSVAYVIFMSQCEQEAQEQGGQPTIAQFNSDVVGKLSTSKMTDFDGEWSLLHAPSWSQLRKVDIENFVTTAPAYVLMLIVVFSLTFRFIAYACAYALAKTSLHCELLYNVLSEIDYLYVHFNYNGCHANKRYRNRKSLAPLRRRVFDL